jgi:heme A synthase
MGFQIVFWFCLTCWLLAIFLTVRNYNRGRGNLATLVGLLGYFFMVCMIGTFAFAGFPNDLILFFAVPGLLLSFASLILSLSYFTRRQT